jgi:hypothetical protein
MEYKAYLDQVAVSHIPNAHSDRLEEKVGDWIKARNKKNPRHFPSSTFI